MKEIYLSYFISAEEKNKILQKDKYIKIIEEDLKNKKYSSYKIFEKQHNIKDKLSENHVDTSLIEYKESFFTRFKNFIFKILHINN